MTTNDASKKGTGAPRELFKDKAYEELRARFDNQQYAPGTVLSERQLAEELGMSKTPVKAALERLEIEGFITVSPQSGIHVRFLTIDEFTEMFELRTALEGYVIQQVAGKVTEEQMASWENNIDRYSQIAGQSDSLQEAVELDSEFHRMPAEFLGNKLILSTNQQYAVRIAHVIRRVFSQSPARVAQSLGEHREIVAAVKQGNGLAARDLIERHLRTSHQLLCDAMQR